MFVSHIDADSYRSPTEGVLSLLPDYGDFYSREASWKGFIETSDWIAAEHCAHPKKWLLLMTHCTSCTQDGRERATRFTTQSRTSTLTFQEPIRQVGDPKVIIGCLKDLNVTWLIREPILRDDVCRGQSRQCGGRIDC